MCAPATAECPSPRSSRGWPSARQPVDPFPFVTCRPTASRSSCCCTLPKQEDSCRGRRPRRRAGALRRSVRWDQNRPARSAVYDARGRSIRTVRTWSGRTPTDVAWRCAALLTMRPAPASSISASAICAVTSTPRRPTRRRPPPSPEPTADFSASIGFSEDAWSAGANDTSSAVSIETAAVNNSVAASRPIIDAPILVRPAAPAILGVPGATAVRKNTSASGSSVRAAPSSATPSIRPAMPPPTASSRPSANSCRAITPRLAPMATRTATSLRRAAALATARFVRLTHAIRRTKPTAPRSTSDARRTSLSTRDASRDTALAPQRSALSACRYTS